MDLENFRHLEICCDCGKTHIGYTNFIKFGAKSLSFLPNMCKHILCDGVIGVCYCVDTEEFGKRTCKLLQESGYMTEEICFASNTSASCENALDIISAKESIRLFVGVGSGSLCEMLKYACNARACDFVYVITAPSTKSFLLNYSIFREDGIPRKFDAKPPIGLICDSEIFLTASKDLCASGYGDLLSSLLDIAEQKMYQLQTDNEYCSKLIEMQEKIMLDFFANYAKKMDSETILYSLVEIGLVEQISNNTKLSTSLVLAGLLEDANQKNIPIGTNKLIFATILSKLYVNFLRDGRELIALPDDRVFETYELGKLCNRENLDYVLSLSSNICETKNLFVLREFSDDAEAIFSKCLGEIRIGLKYFRRIFDDAGYWLSTYENFGTFLNICIKGSPLCSCASILGLMSSKGILSNLLINSI